MQRLILALIISLSCTASAYADVVVRFDEGAPKDRFSFSNTTDCTITNATLTLDLSGSKSGLIFDVTNKGAGVEVFQPLEFVAGQTALSAIPKVRDGDSKVILNIDKLRSGKSIAFTIDVDDTMGGREITVSGSEIAGAKVRLKTKMASVTGTFSSNARAIIRLNGCS